MSAIFGPQCVQLGITWYHRFAVRSGHSSLLTTPTPPSSAAAGACWCCCRHCCRCRPCRGNDCLQRSQSDSHLYRCRYSLCLGRFMANSDFWRGSVLAQVRAGTIIGSKIVVREGKEREGKEREGKKRDGWLLHSLLGVCATRQRFLKVWAEIMIPAW